MKMNDERLDKIVGVVLRTGVILAAALVLAGGILFLASHDQQVPITRIPCAIRATH